MSRTTHQLAFLVVLGLTVAGVEPPTPAVAGPLGKVSTLPVPVTDTDFMKPQAFPMADASKSAPQQAWVILYRLPTDSEHGVLLHLAGSGPEVSPSPARPARWFERAATWIYRIVVRPALKLILSL